MVKAIARRIKIFFAIQAASFLCLFSSDFTTEVTGIWIRGMTSRDKDNENGHD